jgi:putative PEP-CTERM system TPR-repeat lipoprotein
VVLREMNRPDDAKTAYLDLLAKKPDDVAALMGLAELAAAQGDRHEAADRLKQAIAAAPRNPAPGQQLVRLYASDRDWDDALKAVQTLEATFPANPTVVDLAASLRAEMGDLAGAAAEFRALTQRLPNADSVWWRYAGYQDRAGDKEGARTSLQRALEIAPTNATYLEDLVKLDYTTKGTDAALATARSFASKQPAFSDVMVAQVLAYAKRLPEAIDVLTQAQKQHPATIITVRLALLTYAEGKHDEARQMLQSWVKDHDNDVAARVGLADLLMVDHNYDGAQTVYEAVRQRAPDNVVALNNLAWLYARKHDPKAPELARQAYRLAPSPQTSDTLGWALVSDGDAKTALPYLQRAGTALPKDAAIQYHLAVALKDTGENGQARELLQQVLKTNAMFEGKDDAQKLLEQLQHG